MSTATLDRHHPTTISVDRAGLRYLARRITRLRQQLQDAKHQRSFILTRIEQQALSGDHLARRLMTKLIYDAAKESRDAAHRSTIDLRNTGNVHSGADCDE